MEGMMTARVAGLMVIAAATCLGGSSAPRQTPGAPAQPKYDLLLRGGHVIDPRNAISAVRDVAIAGGQDCGGR